MKRLALAYMSLMLGAVHWDRWLSHGLGLALVAISFGFFWTCRQAWRLIRA